MTNLYEAFSVYEGFSDADYNAAIQTYDTIKANGEAIQANVNKMKQANDVQEHTGITEDALKFDFEYMLAQQKNTSMIGMITIATLAIATICLIGRYS